MVRWRILNVDGFEDEMLSQRLIYSFIQTEHIWFQNLVNSTFKEDVDVR